jgi:two-component system nitrogen regulation response regulator GlnG
MLTEDAAFILGSEPRRAERAEPEDLCVLYETMGASRHISHVCEQVKLVAPTDFTVLIHGETGSGKELVANALHSGSARRDRPLVPVDCGSIPATLIESELFGHEKGAFTGAERTKLGKFEVAAGSTLFLDEISNLPLDVQPKLLRALQEKQIWRVGGTQPIAINTRVLAASNQELHGQVRAKKFRGDLYHRLNEFCIQIPPLRERIEDIEHLALRFVASTNLELNKHTTLSRAALETLLSYSWPGNVRELRNDIRRAVLQAQTEIWPEHLSLSHVHSGRGPQLSDNGVEFDGSLSLKQIVHEAVVDVERRVLLRVLRQTQGNKAKAARLLRVDYKTIHGKIKNYGIGYVEQEVSIHSQVHFQHGGAEGAEKELRDPVDNSIS